MGNVRVLNASRIAVIPDPFALAGTVLENRFAIERAVAKGGFGVVYKGQHLTLRKPVAIKVLFIPTGLSAIERGIFFDGFAQEAQTIANLEHPAIVRVYDFGISRAPDDQEIPWMALEWIDGASLAQFLKDRAGQPMSPAEALVILRPVFEGLAFAHEQHVAHRDVKPSNIMMVPPRSSSRARDVCARLLDFGIAKVMSPGEAVGSGETTTQGLLSAFSLPYASPEQKTGMKTGPWTDVHALGLVLTEMLTGQRPYPGRDRIEVEQQIMAPSRPTPSLFGVDVGPWEAVIARAVALRGPDRFQDAGSFLAALEARVPEPQPAPKGPQGVTSIASSAPVLQTAWTSNTITSSPTTSAAPVTTAPRSSRTVLVALGVCIALAAFAGSGWFLHARSTSILPREATAATTAPPPRRQGAPAPERDVPAPPSTPAATPQPASPAPSLAAIPQTQPTSGEVSHIRRRRGRRSHENAASVATITPREPLVAPAPQSSEVPVPTTPRSTRGVAGTTTDYDE